MSEAQTHDDLTRYGPSFVALGRTLVFVGDQLPRYGKASRHSRLVTGAWLATTDEADLLAIEWLATLCAIAIADKTGETPRSVFERKFKGAPDDESWREHYRRDD